ncbi:hypothetical protein KZZ20_05835 [Methylacidiphilum fumariolicum]|nr:hypothetical protein [Candidatus Methylacidiphilum fumarolicum]MBW6415033.1 hypothetical protein [Candidatus Methylacidiphilum fumarolicum]
MNGRIPLAGGGDAPRNFFQSIPAFPSPLYGLRQYKRKDEIGKAGVAK